MALSPRFEQSARTQAQPLSLQTPPDRIAGTARTLPPICPGGTKIATPAVSMRCHSYWAGGGRVARARTGAGGHYPERPPAAPAPRSRSPAASQATGAGRQGPAAAAPFDQWSPNAGSRCTRPFHARGSAAHPGSAGWHAPPPRRPASRTPVRSPRHGSLGPPPPSPSP